MAAMTLAGGILILCFVSGVSALDQATISLSDAAPSATDMRAHLREFGIVIGRYQPGPLNAITDVAGVKVSHVTLI